MFPDQSWLAWKGALLPERLSYPILPSSPRSACVTALHIVAISSTIFRFVLRRHKYMLWWDDYMAIASLVMDGFLMVTIWLWVDPDGMSIFTREDIITSHANCSVGTNQNRTFEVVIFWVWCILSIIVVWYAEYLTHFCSPLLITLLPLFSGFLV